MIVEIIAAARAVNRNFDDHRNGERADLSGAGRGPARKACPARPITALAASKLA